MHNKSWIYVIFALALFGFVSLLFTNTWQLFRTILIIIGMGAIMFFLFRFLFLRHRTKSSEMRKYRQAVKQSKLKYKDQTNRTARRRRSRRRASHLRVIDGHKSKRRNRVLFK